MRLYWWWAGFFGLLGLLSIDLWQSCGELPATVVRHFDPAGVAGGTMPRESYQLTMLLAMNFTGLVSAGALALVAKLPTSMINIPHREFWLADSQREKTIGYLIRWGILLGSVTSLFLWNVNREIVVAHRLTPPSLSLATPLTFALVVAFVVLLAVLLLRFSRVPSAIVQR